jgi:riboflavin transporter FmnP
MAGNQNTNVFIGAYDNSEFRKVKAFRMFLSIIVFTGLSLGLHFLRYKTPWGPSFITVDFSVFTEFVAAIAYGPIIGTVVCLLKFILVAVIKPASIASDIANFLVEAAFIITASLFYYKKNFRNSDNEKDGTVRLFRRRRIIIGSLIGIIPALIVQFITNLFIVFPLLERFYASYGYTKEEFLKQYQLAVDVLTEHSPGLLGKVLPEITDLWQGVLLFNLPATFMKLLAVSLITALIYPAISPFLHFDFNFRER